MPEAGSSFGALPVTANVVGSLSASVFSEILNDSKSNWSVRVIDRELVSSTCVMDFSTHVPPIFSY